IDSVQIIGPVSARRSGRGVTVGFPLAYPAKRGCTATLTMTLQLWNGGRLLEGGGTFDGTCAERGHQDAAFVFRRRGRGCADAGARAREMSGGERRGASLACPHAYPVRIGSCAAGCLAT